MKIKILLLVFLGFCKINCADISDSVKEVKIVNNTDLAISLTCPEKLGAPGFARLTFEKGTSCILLKEDQMNLVGLTLNNVNKYIIDQNINIIENLDLWYSKDIATITFNTNGILTRIEFLDANNKRISYQHAEIKNEELIENKPDLPKKDIPAINSDSEIKNSNSDQFNLRTVLIKNKKLLSVASLITGIALYAWIKKSPKKEGPKKEKKIGKKKENINGKAIL